MAGEGTLRFGGNRIWYRVVGDPADSRARKLPVLALHGGPGLPHDSLEPLEDLARGGRPVVFYDQLGCGNSTRSGGPGPWSVGAFLGELAVVRSELGLDEVHLLGHSWGGLLAMEHVLEAEKPPAGLILVGAVVSGKTMLECRQGFYDGLPRDAREAIRKHEAAGTFEDPEYGEAMDLFYRRHACRLDPWPNWLNRALSKMDVEANTAMWGPPNAPQPGPLRAWDLRPRLGGINVPTLVAAGRYDGMAAGQERDIHAGIPNSELAIFEQSSHYPFAEEPERFLDTLEGFLARSESQTKP
ncbi:proline iminopeptidase-family hydrolase [Rubrobacter tropicus]|nr:proline iminopeptidase-family hydrolase [Rubrobacter tropicus]